MYAGSKRTEKSVAALTSARALKANTADSYQCALHPSEFAANSKRRLNCHFEAACSAAALSMHREPREKLVCSRPYRRAGPETDWKKLHSPALGVFIVFGCWPIQPQVIKYYLFSTPGNAPSTRLVSASIWGLFKVSS